MKLDTFRRLDSHARRIRQLERVETADPDLGDFGYVDDPESGTALTSSFLDVATTEVYWPDEWDEAYMYVTGVVFLDVSVAPAGMEWRVRAGILNGATRGGTAAKTSGDVVALNWFFHVAEKPVIVAVQARKTSGTGTVTSRSAVVGFRAVKPWD